MTIDDLLSADKLISIAERENKAKIQNVFDLLVGITDLFFLLLILLPLYPKNVDGYVYSVNLLAYMETTMLNRMVYWTMFLALILIGILKVVLIQLKVNKPSKFWTGCSVALNIAAVIILAFG